MGRGLYFNRNFLLCPRPVSLVCHEGAVANVDFKLSRSSLDDHAVRRKVDTYSSEAKIVQIGGGSLRIQPPLIRSRYYVRNAKTDVCDSPPEIPY